MCGSENIHTLPIPPTTTPNRRAMEILRERRVSKAKFLKEKYGPRFEFLVGLIGGVQTRKLSMRGWEGGKVWIFSGTTQCIE